MMLWNTIFIFCGDMSQIVRFMGPTRGSPRPCRPQVGPILTPWTLLSGVQRPECGIMQFISHSSWGCVLTIHWLLSVSSNRTYIIYDPQCVTTRVIIFVASHLNSFIHISSALLLCIERHRNSSFESMPWCVLLYNLMDSSSLIWSALPMVISNFLKLCHFSKQNKGR